MSLVRAWRVWAGGLPTDEVYLSDATARAVCAEAMRPNPQAFFRVRDQWALTLPDGGLLLLPSECEVRGHEDVVP